MATFPALTPSSRTYIPGQVAATPIATIDGDEISVRHSNASNGHVLRLGFQLLSRADHYLLISHYSIHGRFVPFDLPSETLAASGLTFPANYLWIYAASPETEEICNQINATVELQLIPPYTI